MIGMPPVSALPPTVIPFQSVGTKLTNFHYGTVGTPASILATTLYAFNLPPAYFPDEGCVARVELFGIFAANGNLKTISVTVGGNLVAGDNAGTNGGGLRCVLDIMRVGGTSFDVSSVLEMLRSRVTNYVAGLNINPALAIPITLVGQNGVAQANDIVWHATKISMSRPILYKNPFP